MGLFVCAGTGIVGGGFGAIVGVLVFTVIGAAWERVPVLISCIQFNTGDGRRPIPDIHRSTFTTCRLPQSSH